jgi:hypothetical protein
LKVKQQRHVSQEAAAALEKALPYANFKADYIERVLAGHGWMVWNVGNLCWVLTMVNTDGEIEVLLCGGTRARECLPHWEAAMRAEPAHKGRVVRVDGRKGWRRYLRHWHCDAEGVLTKRID